MTQTDRGLAWSWPRAGRTALIALLIIAVVWFLTLIPKTVEVFIVATLIAYGVNPLVRRLTRRTHRAAAIGIVYAGLLASIVIVSVIVIPDTIYQLQAFFGNGSTFLTAAQKFADNIQHYMTTTFGARVMPPQLQDVEGHIATEITALFNAALAGAGGLLLGIANVLIIGVTALILSYYLLAHSGEIRVSFYSLFPARAQDKAREFAEEAGRVVGGFIFGQIILSAFCTVSTAIILALFGSQYALLLGVLTGLLYAVPYLGIFVAILLGALLGALQSWQMALVTVVVIFVTTRIADYLLVPKVMSKSVGISPMAIIFAVFAGGELFGIWGLVLAIPAAAIFKVVWRVWLFPWLTGHPMEAAAAR